MIVSYNKLYKISYHPTDSRSRDNDKRIDFTKVIMKQLVLQLRVHDEEVSPRVISEREGLK